MSAQNTIKIPFIVANLYILFEKKGFDNIISKYDDSLKRISSYDIKVGIQVRYGHKFNLLIPPLSSNATYVLAKFNMRCYMSAQNPIKINAHSFDFILFRKKR